MSKENPSASVVSASTIDPPRSTFALLLCYAGMATLSAAISLLPIFLTTLSVDLGGLSDEQLGRIGAVTIGGLVAGIVVSGPLADRYGVRVFAVAGNLLTAAGLVWLSLAGTYASVLAASALMGFGCGLLAWCSARSWPHCSRSGGRRR